MGSRPPSPKSDTELEYQKYDAGAQTMLTGDDFEMADNVNWRWGEVPQTPGIISTNATQTEGLFAIDWSYKMMLPSSYPRYISGMVMSTL